MGVIGIPWFLSLHNAKWGLQRHSFKLCTLTDASWTDQEGRAMLPQGWLSRPVTLIFLLVVETGSFKSRAVFGKHLIKCQMNTSFHAHLGDQDQLVIHHQPLLALVSPCSFHALKLLALPLPPTAMKHYSSKESGTLGSDYLDPVWTAWIWIFCFSKL